MALGFTAEEPEDKKPKTLEEYIAEADEQEVARIKKIAEKLDFTAEDCVHFRKTLLKFYRSIEDRKDRTNVIDTENPSNDVVADVQLMLYIAMLYRGHQEFMAATQEIKSGKPVLRQQCKPYITRYMEGWNRIAPHIPMDDITFVSGYATIDELITDAMDELTKKTYYPLLNMLCHDSQGVDTAILRAIAHGIVGFTFLVMALDCGMKQSHGIICSYADNMAPMIMRCLSMVPVVHRCDVTMTDEMLMSIEVTAKQTCLRVMNPILTAVDYYAQSLDLTEYVASAECSLKLAKEIRAARARYQLRALTMKR